MTRGCPTGLLQVLPYILLLYSGILLVSVGAETRDDYMERRHEFIHAENSERTGGQLLLSPAEQTVNKQLMSQKAIEMKAARRNSSTFPPAMHFFHAKRYIDQSPIFKFIQKMPKGAVLHVHDAALTDTHWLIKRATYDPHCYMCHDEEGLVHFEFFKKHPKHNKTLWFDSKLHEECDWKQVVAMRNRSGDIKAFDDMLYKAISLYVADPDKMYPTVDKAWARFQTLFESVRGLIFYTPVFRDYFYEGLRELLQDNVQYVEIRCVLFPLYDLDGTERDISYTAQTYQEVFNKFTEDHPDFVGVKLIYTSGRSLDKSAIAKDIQELLALQKKFPGLIAGYDLVGQEGQGHPLEYFLDDLLYPSQHGIDLKYFFHAGETNWLGTDVDENIIDALLLNTSRIGHGYALAKHPKAMAMVREADIAIEVNPISNQVLKLVDDLRNHPASVLMSQGIPVVVCPDDPAMWGAIGVSYDFYEAFMGLGGARADLAFLKQLALNSIRFSSMSDNERSLLTTVWQKKWNLFIESVSAGEI